MRIAQRHGALAVIAAVIAIAGLAPVFAGGQEPAAGKTWRTPWGDPDLQGVWTVWDLTPFEAPADAATVAKRRAARAAAEAKRAEVDEGINPSGPDGKGTDGGLGGGMSRLHFGPRNTARRLLVVDPPEGRIPYIPREEGLRTLRSLWDTWETHGEWSRCITNGVPGKMLTGGNGKETQGYDKAYQIFQTPGYVVLFPEEIHDARIVPMDGRPHLDPSIHQWNGDSRGRWEGQTLVVETTNFKKELDGLADSHQTETLRLTERFTRLDDKTLDYQITVEDPAMYTRPWTARQPHNMDPKYVIYEYACHEGNTNYMSLSLKQGRIRDAEAAARKAASEKKVAAEKQAK